MRRIIPEIGRHRIPFRKLLVHVARRQRFEILAVALGVGTGRDEEVVVLVACGCVHFSGTVVGQGTSPVVVAVSTEGHRRELELLVRADASHPQGACVQRADSSAFGHFVRSLAGGSVLPQRSPGFNEGADVVPFEVTQASCRSTGCGANGRLVGHAGCATWGACADVLVAPRCRGEEEQRGE